jgi:anti-sigma factor RsiW
MSAQMSCRELVELVTDYLEDALAPTDRAAFEAHLAICPGCVAYLDQMRRTITLTGSLTEDSLSPAVRDELLAAFRSWKRA